MNDLIVRKVDSARKLLAQANTLQQTKSVLDITAALEVYARRQKLGEEAIGYAHEIKIYALHKLGEMLKAIPKNSGARGVGKSGIPIKYSTLEELGIDAKISSLAQQIADLPIKELEAVAKRLKSITQVTREKRAEDIRKMVSLPDAKYRVIYADPPWSYGNNQQDSFGEQRDHYPVMSLSAICEMPIQSLCEDHAALFLWVTSPILEESFEVINAWGFKYKASFVWDKVKHVMGHYNSVRHEFLLICTHGSGIPETPKLFDSVITEERREHSVKPEIFYDIIEALYPSGKRLELFARRDRIGWDRYGYE